MFFGVVDPSASHQVRDIIHERSERIDLLTDLSGRRGWWKNDPKVTTDDFLLLLAESVRWVGGRVGGKAGSGWSGRS